MALGGSHRFDDVSAVIYGTPQVPQLIGETLTAVRGQTRPPAHIVLPISVDEPASASGSVAPGVGHFACSGSDDPFAAGVRAAAATGARWLWLLDGVTIPEPDALFGLMALATEFAAGDAPVLVVSKVIDGSGHLHPDAIPRHEIFEKERSVEAATRRVVQLRAACHGSSLISAAALQRFGLPRSDLPVGLDMFEWSARMLRRWEDTGYLVPASVATRRIEPAVSDRGARRLLARARLLTGDAWSPTEKLWEAFLLGEEVLTARTDQRK